MSTTPSHIARYTVVQPIAAGGMGEVFLARDEKLDRLVAIKLLRDGFDNEELRGRFEEEARNVAKLTHPNIVTIYEYGAYDGRPYIAMEYVAGHSMAELIRRKMPLPLARRIRLIEELCSGLTHAHKAHLVHRDVKPANLMVTTSGMLKVLDFGIAKLRGTDRTQQGMLVGTLNYMSPEQITGQPVDHRSDIFAVGAVLHEVLTYEQAFKGDLTTAMFAIVHGQPERLSTRCPGLDAGFQRVVDRCLAKAPADRYQDLSMLKRDLARLRKPLEEDDADAVDTVVSLDLEKAMSSAPSHALTARPTEPRVDPRSKADRVDDETAVVEPAAPTPHLAETLVVPRPDESALRRRAGEIARAEAEERARVEAEEAERAEAEERAKAEAEKRKQVEAAEVARAEAERHAQAEAEKRKQVEAAEVARAEAERRREEQARRAAEAEHAKRVRTLLDQTSRTADPLSARRAAAAELLRLVPQHVEASARLAQLDAAIAEAAHQQALDAALVAGETLLAQGQFDAAETHAADVTKARPRDSRALRLVDGVVEARRARDLTRAAVVRAESLAADRQWDAAVLALDAVDPNEPGVAALLALVGRERAQEARRQRGAARAVRIRLLASNRVVWAGLGAAATLALTVWLWPAPSLTPAPSESPTAEPADSRVAQIPVAEPPVTPAPDAKPQEDAKTQETVTPQPPVPPEPERQTPPVQPPAPVPTPVPAPAATVPVRVGANVKPPRKVRNVDPVYPANAMAAGIQGVVVVEIQVGTDGAVTQARALRSIATLDQAALAAVRQWRFTPTIVDGIPRPVIMPVSVPFTLAAKPPVVAERTEPVAPPVREPERPPVERSVPVVVPPTPRVLPAEPPAPGPVAPAPIPTPTPPPVSDGGAALRQADEARVRALLGAFGQAYEAKDMNGLKRVWPAMARNVENSYRGVFQSYSRLSWGLQSADVDITGNVAVARAAVQVVLRDLRSDGATTERRAYRFTFERKGAAWTIANVENLR